MVRDKFKLKSQMTCSVFRHVAATYHDKEHRSRLHTFTGSSMVLQHGRDWSITGNRLSVSSINGRRRFSIDDCAYVRGYVNKDWKLGAATLNSKQNGLWLHVSVSKEVSEETVCADTVVGVDLGQNNLAVAVNSGNKTLFSGGGNVKNMHRQTQRRIKYLKNKGTSSARKRLRSLAGKQRRFQRDVNHCVSKSLVTFAASSGRPVIGMEDLSGIRKAPKRGTRARAEFHNWGFYQLRQFVTYKADALGMPVILVNPAYTSQGCSRCGHTERANRKGAAFKCKACGYTLHADLNAAKNIAHRARLSRQVLGSQGSANDPSMFRPLIQDATGEVSGQARPLGLGS